MIGELEALEIGEALPVNRRRALSCACGLSQGIPGYRGDVYLYGAAVWRALRAAGLADAEIQAAGLAAISPADPSPAPAPVADPLPPGVRAGSEARFDAYPGAPADLDQRIAAAALDLASDRGISIDLPADLIADYRPDPVAPPGGAAARLQIEIYRRIGEIIAAEE